MSVIQHRAWLHPRISRRDWDFLHVPGERSSMTGYIEDTIVAISTHIGESGIGIVRMSGEDSITIAKRIFSPAGKRSRELKGYRVYYGHVIDPSEHRAVDEVLLLVMKAPCSYTREDMVEFQCHGGPVPLMRIMELIVKCGARVAYPGEFTRRALLNGRIDMIQAEAVLDMIRSKSEKACEVAFQQLSGRISAELEALRIRLVELIALMEAPVDFPEEEVASMSDGDLLGRVRELRGEMEGMEERSKSGGMYREGLRIAIVGKPNVGKSSLLNVLLSEKRAIVTEYPGTTRDCVQEWFNLKGIPVLLVDTAGIRKTSDVIEREGVQKTLEAVEKAAFVIIVMDISGQVTGEDRDVLKTVKEKGKKYIIALNKVDLLRQTRPDNGEMGEIESSEDTVRISALGNVGISEMEEMIYEKVWQGGVGGDDRCILSNVRHRESLINALALIKEVETGLETGGFPQDVYLITMRKALGCIGDIFGENFNEEILDRIFSEFCIGK